MSQSTSSNSSQSEFEYLSCEESNVSQNPEEIDEDTIEEKPESDSVTKGNSEQVEHGSESVIKIVQSKASETVAVAQDYSNSEEKQDNRQVILSSKDWSTLLDRLKDGGLDVPRLLEGLNIRNEEIETNKLPDFEIKNEEAYILGRRLVIGTGTDNIAQNAQVAQNLSRPYSNQNGHQPLSSGFFFNSSPGRQHQPQGASNAGYDNGSRHCRGQDSFRSGRDDAARDQREFLSRSMRSSGSQRQDQGFQSERDEARDRYIEHLSSNESTWMENSRNQSFNQNGGFRTRHEEDRSGSNHGHSNRDSKARRGQDSGFNHRRNVDSDGYNGGQNRDYFDDGFSNRTPNNYQDQRGPQTEKFQSKFLNCSNHNDEHSNIDESESSYQKNRDRSGYSNDGPHFNRAVPRCPPHDVSMSHGYKQGYQSDETFDNDAESTSEFSFLYERKNQHGFRGEGSGFQRDSTRRHRLRSRSPTDNKPIRWICKPQFQSRTVIRPCQYCKKLHRADECHVVPDVDSREKFVKENDLCDKCLGKHSSRDCEKQRNTCRYCKKMEFEETEFHHYSLCPFAKMKLRL